MEDTQLALDNVKASDDEVIPSKGYMKGDYWHFTNAEGAYVRVNTKKTREVMKLGDEEICWGYLTLPRTAAHVHEGSGRSSPNA